MNYKLLDKTRLLIEYSNYSLTFNKLFFNEDPAGKYSLSFNSTDKFFLFLTTKRRADICFIALNSLSEFMNNECQCQDVIRKYKRCHRILNINVDH